jgi:hypothetical protein
MTKIQQLFEQYWKKSHEIWISRDPNHPLLQETLTNCDSLLKKSKDHGICLNMHIAKTRLYTLLQEGFLGLTELDNARKYAGDLGNGIIDVYVDDLLEILIINGVVAFYNGDINFVKNLIKISQEFPNKYLSPEDILEFRVLLSSTR